MKNVIPELTQLAQENEDFWGKVTKLKWRLFNAGNYVTMGAMFGQTSGLPLSVSIGANGMDTQDSFFPEITTLGDILQKEGIFTDSANWLRGDIRRTKIIFYGSWSV